MRGAVLVICIVTIIGGARAAEPHDMSRAEVYRQAAAMSALGKQLFFDVSLSGSGKMSCASCHSPEHAFGPPNGLAVQPGDR